MITLSCTWDSSPLHPTPIPAATFREGLLTREKFVEEITLSVNYFYTRNEGSHLTLYIVRILLLGNSFLLEAWSVSLLLTLQGGLSGSVLGAQFEDLLANVCLRLCLEMAPSAKTTAPKGSSCALVPLAADLSVFLVPLLWMSTHLLISFSFWYKLRMRQHRHREVKWLSWHRTA